MSSFTLVSKGFGEGLESVLFGGTCYDITCVPKELSRNEAYINTINYYNYSREVKKIPHKDTFPWKYGVHEVSLTGLPNSHKKGVVTGTLKYVALNDTKLILTLHDAYLVESELTPFYMASLRCTFSLDDLRLCSLDGTKKDDNLQAYYNMLTDSHPIAEKYLNTTIAVNVNIFSESEKVWFQPTRITKH